MSDIEEVESGSSVTFWETIHYWHEWEIRDFKECNQMETIESSPFTIKGGETQWHLEFQKDRTTNPVKYSIFLCMNRKLDGILISTELGIIDVNKSFLISVNGYNHMQGITSAPFGGQLSLRYEDLYDQKKNYLRSNTLVIGCKIILRGPIGIPLTVKFDIPSHQLSHDFDQLFNDQTTGDITLSVGTKIFYAHKSILKACSSVFRSMLVNDTKKNIEIEELSEEVVERVLKFIYTDRIEDLDMKTYNFLNAADKFDLKRLKAICEETIYKNVNIETAADIFVMADRYRAEQLKTHVSRFIRLNKKAVAVTEGYKDMRKKHPQLVLEIAEAMGIL